jgi:hypothetical protein
MPLHAIAICHYMLLLWYEHVMPYSDTTCHATNGMVYGTRLATAIRSAICYMPYACSTIYYVQVPTLCTYVKGPHLSLISMLCTMYLQQLATLRRTAVTERSLRDAARMGWRCSRQLHPRQLKGTSSRTRIIAGVLMSAPVITVTSKYSIVSCLP